MWLAVYDSTHGVINHHVGSDGVLVVGACSVQRFDLSDDPGGLMLTQHAADDLYQIVGFPFGEELRSVDTLCQQLILIEVVCPFGNIEPFAMPVADYELQLIIFVFSQQFVCFFQVDALFQHQGNQIDFVDVAVDGAAFGMDAICDVKGGGDVGGGYDMLFIRVPQEILENHVGLQLLMELVAPLIFAKFFRVGHWFFSFFDLRQNLKKVKFWGKIVIENGICPKEVCVLIPTKLNELRTT
jgi:hypothetical protein